MDRIQPVMGVPNPPNAERKAEEASTGAHVNDIQSEMQWRFAQRVFVERGHVACTRAVMTTMAGDVEHQSVAADAHKLAVRGC